MANLKIVNNNIIADAVITASTEAGDLVVENLQTNLKSQIWRSTAKTATITATWTEQQFISLVAFPFCNFSSTATMQVKLYASAGDTVPVYDSGLVVCCPYVPFDDFDWGAAPLGVNAFSYGGGAYARVWTGINPAEKIEVIISDPNNPANYLEAGIMVVGQHWSPKYNFSFGADQTIHDSSSTKRSDAGDSISDRGTRYKSLSLNLNDLEPADRNLLMDLMKGNGKPKPFFISLYPENADTILEQDNQIYGKLAQTSKVPHNYYRNFSSSITVEEI